MPTIYDAGGNAREVSDAEYERLVKSPVASDRQDVSPFGRGQHDLRPRLSIYDTVDGTWTEPIDEEWAFRQYLRKTEWRCSACHFTGGIRDGEIKSHIDRVFAEFQRHETAHPVQVLGGDGRTPKTGCSACEVQYARGRFAQKHIDDILAAGPVHVGCEEQLIFRYSLNPSAVRPPLASRVIGPAGPGSTANGHKPPPDVNQEKRRRPNRHRSRKGRHKENVRA